MGRYRDRVRTCSAAMPDLMLADICDELDGMIQTAMQEIAKVKEQLVLIDRRLTDCCDDSARDRLKGEVSSLRAELGAIRDSLKSAPPNPTP